MIDLPDLSSGGQAPRQLFREVAWDFAANKPIWRGGEPVYVTGAPAVLVWAWNAIQTEMRMHDVFTRDYGLGIRSGLTGRSRSEPDGAVVPVMAEFTLTGSGFASRDWWEVPRGSQLGRALRRCYPCCDPAVDERGKLIGISPWPLWCEYGERSQTEKLCPIRTPPKKRRQQRRSGLFAALLNRNQEGSI